MNIFIICGCGNGLCHADKLSLFDPALPLVLAHSNLISAGAMIMSVAGGILIYGTIISFGMFFQEEQEF